MDTFLGILKDYWGVILFLAGCIVFLITQGRAKAGQIILSLMLRAEKQAEELVLQTGEDKFSWVITQGYQLLPRVIKLFITPAIFEQLANSLYSEAKQYLLSTTSETQGQE